MTARHLILNSVYLYMFPETIKEREAEIEGKRKLVTRYQMNKPLYGACGYFRPC